MNYIPKTYYQGTLFIPKLKGHYVRTNKDGKPSLKVLVDTYKDGYCRITVAKTGKLVGVFDHHPSSLGKPKRRKYKAQLYLDRFPYHKKKMDINICAYEVINPKSKFDLYVNDVEPGRHRNTILGAGSNLSRTAEQAIW